MKKLNLIIAAWFVGIIMIAIIATSCGTSHTCDAYSYNDSISNPENEEFVVEVAFNEGCTIEQVTQEMFNKRYNIK